MNLFTGVGRLVRDPEIKELNGGKNYATFQLQSQGHIIKNKPILLTVSFGANRQITLVSMVKRVNWFQFKVN